MNMLYSQASLDESRDAFRHKDILILPTWSQARVSTKQQVQQNVAKNGHMFVEGKASLDEQKRKCIDATLSYKGNCPKCYREIRLSFAGESSAKGESGRSQDREDVEEILSFAKQGLFKVLVTIDNDRLARKRSTAVFFRDKLKESGVQIYSLAQPVPLKCPDCFDPLDDDTGLIVETLSDMKSQLDLSKIRRNYKIGMPKRIQNGKPSGSLAFGLVKTYKKVGKDHRGNDVMEEVYKWNKEKTDIVKRIASMYLSGNGVWSICTTLNNEDIPSPRGSIWRRSAILHILKNPVYAGKIRFGWKPVKNGSRNIQPRDKWLLTKAQFKGIWSWEYYEKIQEEIKLRVKIGGRATGSKALLIGLLKCGYCKGSMFQAKGGKTLKNGKPYVWRGYACGTFMQGGGCKHNGVKQERLDMLILEEILNLEDETTRKVFYDKLMKSKKVDYNSELERKEKSLGNLLKQFDRVNKAYREGIDTLEEYATNKSKLLPQIEELKDDVTLLRNKVKKPFSLDWKDSYKEAIEKFLKYPSQDEKKNMRIILKNLIEMVEFKKKPKSLKLFYKMY